MSRSPTLNSQGNIEWTEKATAPDGDSLIISLKLDAIDSGSGFAQQNTDSSDLSWLNYSTSSIVKEDGSREVEAEVEVDPGGVSTGNDYRFQVSANDGSQYSE